MSSISTSSNQGGESDEFINIWNLGIQEQEHF